MRLVHASLPPGTYGTVVAVLDEEGVDYTVMEAAGDRYTHLVTFPLPTSAVEPVLERLRDVGVDEDAITVVTEAQTIDSRQYEALADRFAEEAPSEDRIAREELKSTADQLASTPSTYVTLTVVSAVVATAGLLLDSAATVVGSMVIAPLIGPSMAAAVGTVIDDADLFIAAAAVGDYTTEAAASKIKSGSPLTVEFEPTDKVVDAVRAAAPALDMVCFKAEVDDEQTLLAEAQALRERTESLFVVANEATVMGAASTTVHLVGSGPDGPISGEKSAVAAAIIDAVVTARSEDDE